MMNNDKEPVSQPRLYRHRCAVCGMSCETPFAPKKGIHVHCAVCHKALAAGMPEKELRLVRQKETSGQAPAVQSYMGRHGELFEAVCEDCGQPCRVPFVPDGERQILCRTCFQARKNGSRAEG